MIRLTLRGAKVLAAAILALAAALPLVQAQSRSQDAFDQDYLTPLERTERRSARPMFRFVVTDELPLPGPLDDPGPVLLPEGVELSVRDETAVAMWSPVEGLAIVPRESATEVVDPPPFALSPDGRFRSVPLENGWILMQRRCKRCKRGWKKCWKLRAPGSEFARPLITDRRVYYGATDNRVYCVKRRTGHRVWVTDVGARVLRPLELLRVVAPPDPRYLEKGSLLEMDVILVAPYSGAEIIALDGKGGDRLATFELPENEVLVGGPLAVDGKVLLAVQRYSPADAALLLLELRPVSPDEDPVDAVAPDEEAGRVEESEEERASPGPVSQRTTSSTCPARTSEASAARTSSTSASSGNPGPS
jgi:hypothetical protein